MGNYVELEYDESGWATVYFAQQVIENFKAIVGSNILPESIVGLGGRVTALKGTVDGFQSQIIELANKVDSSVSNINSIAQEVKTEMDSVKTDLSNEIKETSDAIWNNTGDKINLYEYFNDPTNSQRRNLVSSINKLLDDLGYKNQLTTFHKNTLVGAINELDNEIGNLNDISTVNNLNNKNNIVEISNYLNSLIGDLSSNFTSNNPSLKKTNIVDVLTAVDSLLGAFNNIDNYIKGITYSDTINNIKNKIGIIENLTFNGADLVSKILSFYSEYLNKIEEIENKNIEQDTVDNSIKNLIGVISSITPPYDGDDVVSILQKIITDLIIFKTYENRILNLENEDVSINSEITNLNLNLDKISDTIGDISLINAPYDGDSIENIIQKLVNKIIELEERITELESGV